MHGRVKVRTTAEQEAIKKVEREKKVVLYKAALNLVFQKRKDKVYDDELFIATERMLLQNPDITTIWNIRREAIINNDWKDEEFTKRMAQELSLTERCLRENPKSYSSWHYRCWIIDKLPESQWKTELSFCAKCLDLDERNFHCWDYRQHLVKKTGISDVEELEFSTTKIFNNFSNYSSWHYRSKILSKMCCDKSGELPVDPETHKKELDLVMNATFTDPNDSSAFFYQRWLLDYPKSQSKNLWRAKVTSKKAVVIFHSETSVEIEKAVIVKDGVEVSATWCSNNNEKYSKIWIATFLDENQDFNSSKLSINFGNDCFEFDKHDKHDAWFYKSTDSLVDKHNKAQLEEQMDSYQQLVKMEPNNKWAVLTGIFLMKNYDFVGYHEKILKDIDALIKIDNLRSSYYLDMRSKCVVDYKLHEYCQNEKNDEINLTIDLSNLDLSVLYNEHYFGLFEEINLDGNNLEKSFHRFQALQECKSLSLSSNNLKTLKTFPTLKSLETLCLRNNQLVNTDEVLDLIKRHGTIGKLDLRGNPLCNDNEIIKKISDICPTLELQI